VSRVTIGLPFRNNLATLKSALKSIFAQSFSDWELILIADGSEDGSADLVARVKDPRVILVNDGENRGLPSRLNQIARMAKGQYLARMDADDLMHPNRIEMQVRFLDESPHVDVVGTGVCVIDGGCRVRGVRGLQSLDTSPRQVIRRGLFIHPTVMARREWFLSNPYDEYFRRAQDRELWCRTLRTTSFGHIRLPLYFYREYGSFSAKTYEMSCKYERDIIRRYGPAMVGPVETYWLVTRTYIKAGAYRVLSSLNLHEKLLERRSQSVDEKTAQELSAVLALVLSVPVPGLE